MMKNATTSSISKTSARALWSMSLKSAAFLASAPRSRLEMIRLPCAPLASKPAANAPGRDDDDDFELEAGLSQFAYQGR